MPKPKFKYSFDYNLHGLPCSIGVFQWEDHHWDWVICDRKGYRADWLAKKLTLDDIDTIKHFLTQRIEGD